MLLPWQQFYNRFATVEQAQQAKDALNGADIYTGCNTLKIEYSRVHYIVVFITAWYEFCSLSVKFQLLLGLWYQNIGTIFASVNRLLIGIAKLVMKDWDTCIPFCEN